MRATIALATLLVVVMLPVIPAAAADSPEMAQRKREMTMAYQVFHTHGICGVYVDVKLWQEADWPDGRPAVVQFLHEKVLPRFSQDPAALANKTTAELELEFLRFCTQIGDQFMQVLNSLQLLASGAADGPQPTAAEAAQKEQLRDSLRGAEFLGQCQATSALYLETKPEYRDQLEKFVIAEVFAKDPKYRHEAIDLDILGNSGKGDLMAEVKKLGVNEDKKLQYARDCDTIEAKFNEIFEQLKESP